MTGQPDVAGAVLALDRAMIALAVAKSTLPGEVGPAMPPPGLVFHGDGTASQNLAAAEASPANPYGSAKHGEYTAPSAAAGAQDVDRCPECARDIATEEHQIGCPLDFPPTPTGHLPQHTHGDPRCTYCGEHHVAVTR